jgi:hypothetical protein
MRAIYNEKVETIIDPSNLDFWARLIIIFIVAFFLQEKRRRKRLRRLREERLRLLDNSPNEQ